MSGTVAINGWEVLGRAGASVAGNVLVLARCACGHTAPRRRYALETTTHCRGCENRRRAANHRELVAGLLALYPADAVGRWLRARAGGGRQT